LDEDERGEDEKEKTRIWLGAKPRTCWVAVVGRGCWSRTMKVTSQHVRHNIKNVIIISYSYCSWLEAS
jgi:hypothetical protein